MFLESYDLRYQVSGEDVPIKLKYKDIIFVMEDVDAASKIVHKRSGGPSTVRVEVTTTGKGMIQRFVRVFCIHESSWI